MIFPNLLRIGTNNNRALSSPVKLPKNPGELLKKVEDAFAVFYELWNTSLVPKLMKSPKWFDTKSSLKEGDIIYFKKVENELSSDWSLGKVVDITLSRRTIYATPSAYIPEWCC